MNFVHVRFRHNGRNCTVPVESVSNFYPTHERDFNRFGVYRVRWPQGSGNQLRATIVALGSECRNKIIIIKVFSKNHIFFTQTFFISI